MNLYFSEGELPLKQIKIKIKKDDKKITSNYFNYMDMLKK